jgi:hypothetical protein
MMDLQGRARSPLRAVTPGGTPATTKDPSLLQNSSCLSCQKSPITGPITGVHCRSEKPVATRIIPSYILTVAEVGKKKKKLLTVGYDSLYLIHSVQKE